MKTIILGTAHLKSTPGKCSPDKKFFEYKYSREICKAIKVILEKYGYKVFIDIEDDDTKDTLVSASLNISNDKRSSSASIILGKGTPSLCIEKLIKTLVGRVSWLKVVSAI